MQRDVLIVEDDESFAASLVDMLLANGHRPARVRDELEARRYLDSGSPCLILVGLLAADKVRALIRFLRSEHRTIPTVIMSTGNAAGAGRGRARARYRDADVPVITRPADSESLLRVVNRFCAPQPLARAVVN